jgi:DNA invertase Pin-like site-specific DNA recombinase
MQRCAIYTRISRDAEQRREGVSRQEDECRARAEREGWDIVEVFTDNDISASGYSRRNRPAYERLIAGAREGRYEIVLAYSNSRLTRRLAELEDLIRLHDETGILICTVVSGDDNMATADGRMTARIKASVDAAEAERVSERVRSKQAQMRAHGQSKTRRAFGWGYYEAFMDVDGKASRRLRDSDRINPVEAEALRTASEEVLRGVSTSEIARRWNAEGVPSITGVKWSQRRIVELLTRWRNGGVVVHRGEPVEGVVGVWETVCTRERLVQVRQILLDPSRRTMTPGRPPTALMSTAAVCGKCRRKLVASKAKARDGSERFMYRCSGALSTSGPKCYLGIKRETLDKLALDAARRELALGHVDGLAPGADERARLRVLRDERAELVEEEKHVGEAIGAGRLSVVAGTAAQAGISTRREELDRKIDKIEKRYTFADLFQGLIVRDHKVDLMAVAEVGRSLKALSVSQQREVIKGLFEITVYPGRDAEERVKIERRSGRSV